MSRKKHKPLEQLALFTDEQLRAMAKPAKRKKAAKKEKAAPISDEEITAMAVIDCLADAGYRGPDPLTDFLTGKEPTHKQRYGGTRN